MPSSPFLPSALLASRITGLPDLRTRSAKGWSIGVRPSRASIMNRMTSACSIAVSVWARMRPASESLSASSSPAVSMIVKRRWPSAASPSRRSRVTPGRSSTSASFLPTSRLNSVDLPTLGRPMMATVAVMKFELLSWRQRTAGRRCSRLRAHRSRPRRDDALGWLRGASTASRRLERVSCGSRPGRRGPERDRVRCAGAAPAAPADR